ncbi:MAG: serine hydrolase domain-containing protein [Nitriliruptoraceae bacterium]
MPRDPRGDGARSDAGHPPDDVAGRARRHVGFVVGLSDGGDRSSRGFGVVARGGVRPDERTSFQIGSITKVFTALLLADAVHRGEVTYDQPLTTVFPAAAAHPSGRPIQLADLASHTSGLPRLPRGSAAMARRSRDDPYVGFTDAHLEAALTDPPRRAPGGRPRYSNLGAGVLGEALARVTGWSYEALVQERIAAPLGLVDTRVQPDGSEASVSVGHTRRGRPVGDWHLASLAGAGALRSSVADLLLLLEAHLAPASSPLELAIRDVMRPRARVNRSLGIGLGWHLLHRRGGASWWWHNGGTGGFRSFVGFDPAAARGVVALANDTRSVDRIGHRLLAADTARTSEARYDPPPGSLGPPPEGYA